MTRQTLSGPWVTASITLAAVVTPIRLVPIIEAGQVAPVSFWPAPRGTDPVLTTKQYELALVLSDRPRIAASATIVLALTAVMLSFGDAEPPTDLRRSLRVVDEILEVSEVIAMLRPMFQVMLTTPELATLTLEIVPIDDVTGSALDGDDLVEQDSSRTAHR